MTKLTPIDVAEMGRIINELKSFHDTLNKIMDKKELNNPKYDKQLKSLKTKLFEDVEQLIIILDKV